MVSAKTVKGLSERLAKTEALVANSVVFPVAGSEGYAVVRNGGGDSMYLVRFNAGRDNCTCADFKNRQGTVGRACKHIQAAELSLGTTSQPPTPAAAADRVKIDMARAIGIMAPAKAA